MVLTFRDIDRNSYDARVWHFAFASAGAGRAEENQAAVRCGCGGGPALRKPPNGRNARVAIGAVRRRE